MTKSLLLKGLAGVAAVGGTVGGGIVAVNSNLFGGKGAALTEPKSEDVSNLSDREFIDKAGLNCQLGEEDTEIKETDSKDCTVKEGSTLRVMVGTQEEDGITFNTTSSGSAKLKVSRSEEVGGDGTTDKYTKKLKFVVDSGDITLSKEGGSPAITKLGQFETYEIFLKDKDKFYLRRKTEAKVGKKNALGLGECELPDKDRDCSYKVADEIKNIKFDGQSEGITISSGTVYLKVTKMGDSDSDFGDEKYRFTFKFPQQVTINSKQLKANIPYDFKIKKGSGNTLTLEKAWSEDKEFAKKAGLKCENENECSVPADSGLNLNVKVGESKREGIESKSGSGKIKMEKDQAGYNQGLKFTITTGDVDLTGGTESSGITKLEELETYEITEEGGKYYLTRKTTREESIRSSLSIPESCFKTSGGSCTLSKEQIKNINFHEKDTAGASMASGTATLTVTKEANTTDFPFGYKFTLKSQQEITIKNSDNKVKANVPTDFKIKKEDGKVSLEKAWSDTDYSFAKKVGLECTTGANECCSLTTGTSEKLNVKKGNDKKDGITSFSAADSGSGKIKVEKEQAGYNQGLKFTITGGDVTLTDGTKATGSTNDIQKLEELETYEITEEGDKYYLTRKTEAIKTIESQLGLTDAGCSLSGTSSTCSNLTAELLKKINFSDKEENNVSISSGTASLTITKVTDKKEDFPLGYKFTLQSTSGDITIKTGSNVVKKNISTDYKIKKSESSPTTLTLEKAWTEESLGKKVGLQSCTTQASSIECTIQESGGQLRVKQQGKHGAEIKSGGLSKASGSSGSGKIKVTKDQEGYNQGFKFKIEDGSINLSGSSGSDDDNKIHTLGEFETYEIKEEGTEWYLVRKERADKYIKEQLKLNNGVCSDSENFPHTNSQNTTCNNISDSKLQNINFEGKSGHTWTSGISVDLEIKKDTSLTGGFKFIFTCNNPSTCCLPGSSNATKESGSSGGFVYQIKKASSGGGLCLAPKTSGSSGGTCAK